MSNIQIAIVGAGLMGHWHAQAAKYLKAKITAIIDPQLNHAQALAKHHQTAQTFASLQACLARCQTNVIHVCTPLDSHAELIDLALQAGCHVLAEKPLASSLPETKNLIAKAKDRSLKLNPVHQFPYQTGFLWLLQQQQRLGDLVRITYHTCSAGGTFKSAAERRCLMLEILPHPVSLLWHLLGEQWDFSNLKVLTFTDDYLELTGLGNTHLSIVISLQGRPTRNELQIVGTTGTAYVDLFHGYALLEEGKVSRSAKIIKPFRFGTQLLLNASSNLVRRILQSESAYPGLRELIRRFYYAVSNNSPAPISDTQIITAASVLERARLLADS